LLPSSESGSGGGGEDREGDRKKVRTLFMKAFLFVGGSQLLQMDEAFHSSFDKFKEIHIQVDNIFPNFTWKMIQFPFTLFRSPWAWTFVLTTTTTSTTTTCYNLETQMKQREMSLMRIAICKYRQ